MGRYTLNALFVWPLLALVAGCGGSSTSGGDGTTQDDVGISSDTGDTASHTESQEEERQDSETTDQGSTDKSSDSEVESDPPVETVPPECETGQQAQCVAVDPGYPSGTAICGDEGEWDLSGCWYGDAFTEPGGWIDPGAAVKIGYILNGARMEDQMYILQHQTQVLPKAVFRGEHLHKPFPPAGVNLTYGWRVDMSGEPAILVLQMTNQGITPKSPMVQMIFLTDDLEPGDYLVGQDVVASLINVDAKTQSQCVVGVAYGGSVRVTESKNTTKVEGGSFSFELPYEIHLYHPSDTTFGDLSGTFEGIEVCP
ncbi:MAG: hypothetical protein MUC50_11960 [Myxococcota bacterium]|nr:hypothetical protein [Myxococcota bacterium]